MKHLHALPLYIESRNITVSFKKVDDHQWREMRKFVAPIFEDWAMQVELDRYFYPKSQLDLPRIYTALFTCFGQHNTYDDYKCSFNYRFELTVEKQRRSYDYALSIADTKGSMPYFTYYRKTAADRIDVYQRPVEAEFSQEDMRFCTLTFLQFLRGFYNTYAPFFRCNFYRVNPSAMLIYGYRDGAFFEEQFDPEEAPGSFQLAVEDYLHDPIFDTPMSLGTIYFHI